MSDFSFRPGVSNDWPLIYSATQKSLRDSPFYADLTQGQYLKVINHVLDQLLQPPYTQVIAHPTGYPDEIAGFILYSPQAIGTAYVKFPYRDRGLGRQLLEHATSSKEIVAVLAQPRVMAKLRDEGYRVRLSPYLAM